jgi:hypothetical protein
MLTISFYCPYNDLRQSFFPWRQRRTNCIRKGIQDRAGNIRGFIELVEV